MEELKLQTPVPVGRSRVEVSPDDKICVLGSCFADNIGEKMNGEWPGKRIMKREDIDGEKWYCQSFRLTRPDQYINLTVSNQSGNRQTIDLTGIRSDRFLVITGDASIASQSFEIRLDGTPTAIDFSQANDGQGQWYNLSGQQVVNGKGQAHGLFLQPTGGSGYRKVLK